MYLPVISANISATLCLLAFLFLDDNDDDDDDDDDDDISTAPVAPVSPLPDPADANPRALRPSLWVELVSRTETGSFWMNCRSHSDR